MTLNILGHYVKYKYNEKDPGKAFFEDRKDLGKAAIKAYKTGGLQDNILDLIEKLTPNEIAFFTALGIIQIYKDAEMIELKKE